MVECQGLESKVGGNLKQTSFTPFLAPYLNDSLHPSLRQGLVYPWLQAKWKLLELGWLTCPSLLGTFLVLAVKVSCPGQTRIIGYPTLNEKSGYSLLLILCSRYCNCQSDIILLPAPLLLCWLSSSFKAGNADTSQPPLCPSFGQWDKKMSKAVRVSVLSP